MQLFETFRRARRLPSRRRSQLALAAVALTLTKMALGLLPFRRAITLGSRTVSGVRRADGPEVDEWVRAVKRASRAAPWRSVCIHEAIALQWLLRSRGVPAVLYYGTTMANGELEAHAWVDVADRTVIGGEVASQFRVLAAYPSC